ncbi:MAG: cupin domain-containing protein [Ruminococcus sp.]
MYCEDGNRFSGSKRWDCEMMTDYGAEPYTVGIAQATKHNKNFRTALWTGCHLQLTLMCIPAGGEIGLEIHPDTDQLFHIEMGRGRVKMGKDKRKMNFQKNITSGDAVFVPAGTWHNIVNDGICPLKLFSVYAPPKHPHGTVHTTKSEADLAEG